MSIELEERFAFGNSQMDNRNLGLILLGPPSAGKSSAMGSLGVRTLYLYGSGESHGPASAKNFNPGSDILPFCFDLDSKGNPIDPDQAMKELLELLQDHEKLKKYGIKAICLDGATELEALIYRSQAYGDRLAVECKGNKSYSGHIVTDMMRVFVDALKSAQIKLGIHYVISCLLIVREASDNGIFTDASPQIAGYNVAVSLLQQIPDRLIIGHTDIGSGKVVPRLQIASAVNRVTKDFNTKQITKIANFRCQLQGVDLSEVPTLAPNLANLIEYKKLGRLLKKDELAAIKELNQAIPLG